MHIQNNDMSQDIVKIIYSQAIFGVYECQYYKTIILRPENLTFRMLNAGEQLNLVLSFKHITKVEVLNNEEDCGAGLIIHVNEFMAQRVQEALFKDGTGFINFKSPYAPNNFVILDILNCDPASIFQLMKMLERSEDFHRRYVIEQCNKTNIDAAMALPTQYISTIPYSQWKALLGTMGKDVYLEYFDVTLANDKPLRYGVGTIYNCQPNINKDVVYSIQQDGTVLKKLDNVILPAFQPNSDGNNLNTNGRQKMDIQNSPQKQSIKFEMLPNFNNTEFPMDIIQPNIPSTSQPSLLLHPSAIGAFKPRSLSLAQKREIHLIEDEESEEQANACPAKKANDTALVYPSTGRNSCSIKYSDLKYLDFDYMLNDTIIDFYLKYIYYELISEERREKMFMFNTFFYSKLTKSPPHGRSSISSATRTKRVYTNFQSIKSWTKKVNLFSMDYVIVPINEDIHWYLAVIINPKAGIVDSPSTDNNNSKKNNTNDLAENSIEKFHIVIFDSLIEAAENKHSLVLEHIAEYLALEYADKKKENLLTGDHFNKSAAKLIIPKGMPQQKNFVDCGLFLLQFAEIFMTNPPTKMYKNTWFINWYPDFKIKGKREEVKAVIRRLAPNVKYSDFLVDTFAYKKKAKRGRKPVFIENVRPRGRRHSISSARDLAKELDYTSNLRRSISSDSFEEGNNNGEDDQSMNMSFRDWLKLSKSCTQKNISKN